MDTERLFGSTWQLEHMAVPGSSIDAMFPDIKPEITFDKAQKQVFGNSGCNGYQAPYDLSGQKISFGEPGPSTLMYCGEGENHFRKHMRSVSHWKLTSDGKLELLNPDTMVLRFVKTAP